MTAGPGLRADPVAVRPTSDAAIIDVAGVPIAFGLSWRRLRGLGGPDREAREEARRIGAAAVVVRPQRRHFAFARELELPRMRRVRVAAAAVADAFPHALIGAWPLPGGQWWCVALDRGEPYPLFGDQLVADETAARTWFERHRPENDWSTLAVPAAWEANRATPVDLAEILSRGGGASLEPVRRGLPVSLGRVAAGIAAIAILGLSGLWLFAPAPQPVRSPAPKPIREAEPPPSIIPAPSTVAVACVRLIEAVSPALPSAGWSGTRAECRVDHVARAVHLTTTVRPLVKEVIGLMPIQVDGATIDHAQGIAVIERDGPLGTAGRPLPDVAPAAGGMAQTLVTAAARAGVRLAVDPLARQAGQTALHWMAGEIRYLPALLHALDPVPGIRVIAVDLDLNTFLWTVRGEAHVAPFAS